MVKNVITETAGIRRGAGATGMPGQLEGGDYDARVIILGGTVMEKAVCGK